MRPEQKQKIHQALDRLFVWFQAILPTRLMSTLVFKLARIEREGVKNFVINAFMKRYPVDLSESEFEIPANYPSFNAFFTRALKPGTRKMVPDPRALACPVDGTISQIGHILEDAAIQAKGHSFTITSLLGGHKDLAQQFWNGRYCTLYLAPHNYHRIHMPATGTLRSWVHVPGALFSVNAVTTRTLPQLFCRNERVCSIFDTDHGVMGVVMVGAMLVGSIETTWAGMVTPPHGSRGGTYQPMQKVTIGRGVEMGRFNMGSTVILLAGATALEWLPELVPDRAVRVGQTLGTWKK